MGHGIHLHQACLTNWVTVEGDRAVLLKDYADRDLGSPTFVMIFIMMASLETRLDHFALPSRSHLAVAHIDDEHAFSGTET